jgi:hypothetical protein
MKDRCNNPNNPRAEHYSEKGITVCARWQLSFANFLEDMGERPEGMTLDRIDVNDGYHPGNCKWSTPVEQMRNTSRVVMSMELARAIRHRLTTWTGSQRALARLISTETGIKDETIREVLKGRLWKEQT